MEKWSNSVGPQSNPRPRYAGLAQRRKPTGQPEPAAPRGRARGGAADVARQRPSSRQGQRGERR